MEITWVCRVGKSRISDSLFTVKVQDILGDCPRSPISQTSLGEPYPKGPRETSQIKEKLTSNSLQCLKRKPHQPLPVFRRILFSGRMKFGFCGGRKTAKSPEKNPRSKARTKTKLKKHTATGRNQTQATLVGGERSHYSDISVLLISCMTLRQVTGVILSGGLSFCITLSHLYLLVRKLV